MLGSLLAFVGEAGARPVDGSARARPGRRHDPRRHSAFGASLEPYLLNEGGSLAFAGIPGEYLTFTNAQGQIVPWLATRWKPNANATVWTFQIRKGVKFHNGKTLTARDVVASMKQYAGAKGSNAGLSPFFDAAGVSARGDYTVVFRLKSAIGVFPYLVSQTTYQAIIQPAALAAKPGGWVKAGMIGTGAFKLKRYVDKKSAELVRHDGYWGGPPPLDGVRITFYQGAPAVLGLRAGQIDLAMQLAPGGLAVQEQPEVHRLPASDRCPPSGLHADGRGRAQAIRGCVAVALVINRPQQVDKVMLGAAQVGNDNPFWKGSPRPTGRSSSARRTSRSRRHCCRRPGRRT
jgi:peptide/nickel transport system substrate-binding protein